jgi:hypothetical protein
MRAEKIIETQEAVGSTITSQSLTEIQSRFDSLEFEYERTKEQLLSLDMILDNSGWTELLGGGGLELNGPTLEQIRIASNQLRELAAVNAHLKRGHLLRANYVFDGGIHYEGVKGGQGAGNKSVQANIDDPQNQREYFGKAAQKKRMKARYTDGHVVWIGNDATKTLRMIPFERITGTLTNPEDSTEVWAVRVIRQVNKNNADPKLEARWIFLDEFIDKRVAKPSGRKGITIPFTANDQTAQEVVDFENRIFLEVANPTVGWTWGTPDALAAMGWIRLYREFLISGKKMSDSMAMIWAQYKSTAAGSQNASVQVGNNKQNAGGTSFGGGDWNVLSTAGKSYEFDSGRPLLAAAATALEISVVALASDPGAAGSSYGSAQTLDLPGRIAISAIRDEIAEFDQRVLKWMGAKKPVAWFDSLLDDAAIYRMIQSEMFYWNAGLREAKEQKQAMNHIKGMPADVDVKVPDGVMLPNNVNSWERTDVDPSATMQASIKGGKPTQSQTTPSTSSTPAPDQGKSNGTGGQGSPNDLRKDTVS